jgi:hypothetical protein
MQMKLIDFEPIQDEIVFGSPDARIIEQCYYWPFGELLANFYKLARRNAILFPVTNFYDLKNVTDAMHYVFKKLPADDSRIITEDYLWFLEISKVVAWQPVNFDFNNPKWWTQEEKERYYRVQEQLIIGQAWNDKCEAAATVS